MPKNKVYNRGDKHDQIPGKCQGISEDSVIWIHRKTTREIFCLTLTDKFLMREKLPKDKNPLSIKIGV